jgi:hypothetical protein
MMSSREWQISFLLSLPRSGSTLLSMMLDNHPAVASPPEPWAMLALHQLGHTPVRHPANAQSIGTGFRNFVGTGGVAAARAAADTLYGRTLAQSGKSIFIDKTPRYHLILDYLPEVYPEARFIWLKRNPLDVAASYRSTWDIDLPALLDRREDDPAAIDFTFGLDRLARFAADHPQSVHVLRYEDLVADPVGELKTTLAFLGADAAPEILATLTDLTAATRPADALGDEKIRRTSAPHRQSVNAWETAFSLPELQILFDALGRERLEQSGYGETARRLIELGLEDRSCAGDFLACYENLVSVRLHDITRMTSLGGDLRADSPAVQERARFLSAGDEAWRTRYADRADMDRMQGFIDAERDEYARQHGILHQEIAKRDLMVAERDDEIGNRGRHIALVEGQREQLRGELQQKQAVLTERDAELEQAAHKLAQRNEAVSTLQQALDAARTAIAIRDARLAEMVNSRSWRITAPLRALARLLR